MLARKLMLFCVKKKTQKSEIEALKRFFPYCSETKFLYISEKLRNKICKIIIGAYLRIICGKTGKMFFRLLQTIIGRPLSKQKKFFHEDARNRANDKTTRREEKKRRQKKEKVKKQKHERRRIQ